jgi:membrane protein
MARLTDLPAAIRTAGFFTFVNTLRKKVRDDRLTTHAAAVAYAWLFALFPFIIFLLTLAAYVPKKWKVHSHTQVRTAVSKVMAKEAADTIVSNLDQVMGQTHNGLLSIGILVTLWIASGGMSITMTALDAAFNAGRNRPFYVQRSIAIVLTIVITAMFVLVLVLLPVASYAEDWLKDWLHLSGFQLISLTIGRNILGWLLTLSLLSLLYHYGTSKKHRYAFFSPGAIFTTLVWFGLGVLFRRYIDAFGERKYQQTYGALGGVTIILLFFYLDALVLLIGAEINSEVDQMAGQASLFSKAK